MAKIDEKNCKHVFVIVKNAEYPSDDVHRCLKCKKQITGFSDDLAKENKGIFLNIVCEPKSGMTFDETKTLYEQILEKYPNMDESDAAKILVGSNFFQSPVHWDKWRARKFGRPSTMYIEDYHRMS